MLALACAFTDIIWASTSESFFRLFQTGSTSFVLLFFCFAHLVHAAVATPPQRGLLASCCFYTCTGRRLGGSIVTTSCPARGVLFVLNGHDGPRVVLLIYWGSVHLDVLENLYSERPYWPVYDLRGLHVPQGQKSTIFPRPFIALLPFCLSRDSPALSLLLFIE